VRTVAAFDFDGTLVPGDSLIPFLTAVRGRAAVGRALAVLGPSIGWALAGRGDRDAAKERLVSRLLAGVPRADVAKAGDVFARVLLDRVRPSMLARLGWHRDEGHELVLVSASLGVYLEPLGDMLGLDAVLATGLEVAPDGLLTGRLAGGNVRGPEKAARLTAWLDGDACQLYAYGDSAGDHELLGLAPSRAFLVHRRGMRPWDRPAR
jgi:phosphatidylglycerophosphatase C